MTEHPIEFSSLPREQILDLARKQNWVHSIDLGDGFVTPGEWAETPTIGEALNRIDFRGKKVLDIGCWDGKYSFLAEAGGASEVYATDLVSQRDFQEQPTFQLAHAALRSKVKYYPNLSVYDVKSLGISDFDVVLFTGVYYHLKDPLRAFSTLRGVVRDGGLMVTEGAVLTAEGCYANFYYRQPFCGDHSNWWVPTLDCLKQWVECSFFEIEDVSRRMGHLETQRHTITARAVRKKDPLYSKVPEDLNEYNVDA
jgi:tRNA (mo5U34)-methyltransferase